MQGKKALVPVAVVAMLFVAGCSGTSGSVTSSAPSNAVASDDTTLPSVDPGAGSPDSVASETPTPPSDAEASDEAPSTPDDAESESPSDQTGKFGQVYLYQDGLAVSVSKPKKYAPHEYAAGPDSRHTHALAFTLKVTNGTKKIFDPSLAISSVTLGGKECEEIFDSPTLEGSPDTKILKGRSVSWNEGYACQLAKGELVVQLTPDFDHADALFVGKR